MSKVKPILDGSVESSTEEAAKEKPTIEEFENSGPGEEETEQDEGAIREGEGSIPNGNICEGEEPTISNGEECGEERINLSEQGNEVNEQSNGTIPKEKLSEHSEAPTISNGEEVGEEQANLSEQGNEVNEKLNGTIPNENLSEHLLKKSIDGAHVKLWFEKYDGNKNGSLDEKELEGIYTDLITHLINSLSLEEGERAYFLDDVDAMASGAVGDTFQQIDLDKSGTVEMEEIEQYANSGALLTAAFNHTQAFSNMKELEQVIETVGFRMKLKDALKLGINMGESEDDVAAIFSKFDKDGSNTLDMEELEQMFHQLIEVLLSKLDEYSAEIYDDDERKGIAKEATQKCLEIMKPEGGDDGAVEDATGEVGVEAFRAFIISPEFVKCFSFLIDEEEEAEA